LHLRCFIEGFYAPRVVKILELTETMDYGPIAPNGLWKTLRANSGSCNVMLRPSRLASLGRHVQPRTHDWIRTIEFFDHTESLRASALAVSGPLSGCLFASEESTPAATAMVPRQRAPPSTLAGLVSDRVRMPGGSGCRCRGWSVRSCGAGDFNLSSLRFEGCRRRDCDCRTWATPLGGTPGLR
jgi:hypothetical protein